MILCATLHVLLIATHESNGRVPMVGACLVHRTCPVGRGARPRLDPKPIQEPHVPMIAGGYEGAAYRPPFGSARVVGFNRDPPGAKENLHQLDATFDTATQAARGLWTSSRHIRRGG